MSEDIVWDRMVVNVLSFAYFGVILAGLGVAWFVFPGDGVAGWAAGSGVMLFVFRSISVIEHKHETGEWGWALE